MRGQDHIAVVLRASKNSDASLAALRAAYAFEKQRKVQVIAITVCGPGQSDSICQEALALGCDDSLAIQVPIPFDTFGEALLLQRAIESTRAGLVICTDYEEGHEGSSLAGALAFMLGMHCITGVHRCRFKADDYLVTRRSDVGEEELRCRGPLLLAWVQEPDAPSERLQASKPKPKFKSIPATDLLEDLSALGSRAPLVSHAASMPSAEASELFSSPGELLASLQRDKLWDPV